jgi:hypothetical protein
MPTENLTGLVLARPKREVGTTLGCRSVERNIHSILRVTYGMRRSYPGEELGADTIQ